MKRFNLSPLLIGFLLTVAVPVFAIDRAKGASLEESLTAFSDFLGMDRFTESETPIAVPQPQSFSISNQWNVTLGVATTNELRETVEIPFDVVTLGGTHLIQGRIDWYPTRNEAISGVFLDRFLTPVPLAMELERLFVVTNDTSFCVCLEGDGLSGATPDLSQFRKSFMIVENMVVVTDDSFKEQTPAFLLGVETEFISEK